MPLVAFSLNTFKLTGSIIGIGLEIVLFFFLWEPINGNGSTALRKFVQFIVLISLFSGFVYSQDFSELKTDLDEIITNNYTDQLENLLLDNLGTEEGTFLEEEAFIDSIRTVHLDNFSLLLAISPMAVHVNKSEIAESKVDYGASFALAYGVAALGNIFFPMNGIHR
jgi:hypothetical protein